MSLEITHGKFVIERVYNASPQQVFAAWADPAVKARWFIGPQDWKMIRRELDFRNGGEELLQGRIGTTETAGTELIFTEQPVLMTPLAFTFPTSQRREYRARPANAHGASFPHTDVGNLDAGLLCPLQPRVSDPASRNEALQHSAPVLDNHGSTPVRPLGGVLAK